MGAFGVNNRVNNVNNISTLFITIVTDSTFLVEPPYGSLNNRTTIVDIFHALLHF